MSAGLYTTCSLGEVCYLVTKNHTYTGWLTAWKNFKIRTKPRQCPTMKTEHHNNFLLFVHWKWNTMLTSTYPKNVLSKETAMDRGYSYHQQQQQQQWQQQQQPQRWLAANGWWMMTTIASYSCHQLAHGSCHQTTCRMDKLIKVLVNVSLVIDRLLFLCRTVWLVLQ